MLGLPLSCRVDSSSAQCRFGAALSSGSRVLWLDKQVSDAVFGAEGWAYSGATRSAAFASILQSASFAY